MSERPILFSGEMVRAILDGSKTQTRRVVKPQPIEGLTYHQVQGQRIGLSPNDYESPYIWCPYGIPGDRLWVRETTYWPPGESWNYVYYQATPRIGKGRHHKDGKLTSFYSIFKTDEEAVACWLEEGYRIRPSIHMPRWASRITLEITGLRVERVQDIKAGDVAAEGWPEAPKTEYIWTPDIFRIKEGFDWFCDLWDSINAKRGYSWDANPWVWVVEFKGIES